MKSNVIRVVILLVGLIIAHFGVSLFLLANLGSDPFNVICLFLVGPVAGFFLPRSEKVIGKIVG